MSAFLEISLAFTILSGLVVWFYWAVLFPCLALKSRIQIQKITNEAYLARCKGSISSISFSKLEYFLQLARRMAHHYDMLGIPSKRKPQSHELEGLERRIKVICDDDDIRDVFISLNRWMLALYFASNPMELLKLSILVTIAYYSNWAASQRDREETEVYIHASGLPA
jgi:hypothetical protein